MNQSNDNDGSDDAQNIPSQTVKMSNQSNNNNDDSDIYNINLTVPPDCESGVDSLTFQYNGNEYEILIPEGSNAGDVLQIQVGSSAANNSSCNSSDDSDGTAKSSRLMDELNGLQQDDVRKGISTVTLGEGLKSIVTLQLLEELPKEHNSICNKEGDGTACCLWPS